MRKVVELLELGTVPKAEIARQAGSQAKTSEALTTVTNRLMKSERFQKYAHGKIKMAFDHMDDEKFKKANLTSLTNTVEKLSKVSGLATQSMDIENVNLINVQADKILQYYANDKLKEAENSTVDKEA